MIFLRDYYINTTQKTDIRLVTHDVKRAIRESGVLNGTVTILVPGGTAGIVLLEEDPKIHEELRDYLEQQFPDEGGKRPNRRSGSGRNSAHLRAALIGVNLVLPVENGQLKAGHWQEVVLFDFDDSKIGRREIRIQVVGDGAQAEEE